MEKQLCAHDLIQPGETASADTGSDRKREVWGNSIVFGRLLEKEERGIEEPIKVPDLGQISALISFSINADL